MVAPSESPKVAPVGQHVASSSSSPSSDPCSTTVIEVASLPGQEEDEFDLTDGYETSSHASTSVTSSIYAHTYENGRRYHLFKNGRYPIPNDDLEQNREDMKHAMLMEVNDGKLFFAPIGDHPQKILDIGTGTGIWALEVGEQYPSASVRGIDISPIQPLWVPPNVSFLVDDCEEEWGEKNVDFVHFRNMTPVLKKMDLVLEHAFNSLRPGGWIELQEGNYRVECDDGTMLDDDPLKIIYELTAEAFSHIGMDTQMAAKLGPVLAGAGFANIRCTVRKVPVGVWARDKTMRLVGMYQKVAISEILPATTARTFQALGLGPEEIEVRLALARRSLEASGAHRYFNYYFWYAQKPE